MRREPVISVLLPVWNGEQYIRTSIQSALSQTFQDFELIILDDGSTDRTKEIVSQEFPDPRIVLKRLPHQGIVAALNEGLRASRGQFIARMDVDDISLPQRLEKQINYLENHPRCGIVGTTYYVMNATGHYTSIYPSLLDPADVHLQLLYRNPLGHGTVMIRGSVLRENGLTYRAQATHYEDFDLWLRCSRVTEIANLAEPLYVWMDHPSSVSGQHQEVMSKETSAVISRVFTENEKVELIEKNMRHLLQTRYPTRENWSNYGTRLPALRRAEYQYHLYRLAWILVHQGRCLPASRLFLRSLCLGPQTYLTRMWGRLWTRRP